MQTVPSTVAAKKTMGLRAEVQRAANGVAALAMDERTLAAAALVVGDEGFDDDEELPDLVTCTYRFGGCTSKRFTAELLEVKHPGISVTFRAFLAAVVAGGGVAQVRAWPRQKQASHFAGPVAWG